MASEWMREYTAAKLAEIEEALRQLDASPDCPTAHEERERLVMIAAQLMASLATHSDEQPSLN
jgi:hypothetical protein